MLLCVSFDKLLFRLELVVRGILVLVVLFVDMLFDVIISVGEIAIVEVLLFDVIMFCDVTSSFLRRLLDNAGMFRLSFG